MNAVESRVITILPPNDRRFLRIIKGEVASLFNQSDGGGTGTLK